MHSQRRALSCSLCESYWGRDHEFCFTILRRCQRMSCLPNSLLRNGTPPATRRTRASSPTWGRRCLICSIRNRENAFLISAAEMGRLQRRSSQQEQRDRKSTRLNSSHQIISYAVFCLKKKKTKM